MNVNAPAVGTIVCPYVRPFSVCVVVENAIEVAVVEAYPEPSAVSVPAPLPTQVPLTAKHPVVMFQPTLDVDVAEPEMVRPLSVVVPKPELDTRSHGAVVDPTQNEKASPDTESTESLADGEVVPIPRLPTKYEFAVVVEIKFPTVSCVPVALRLPDEFVVTIEFGENVVAENTCDASVEVETVLTSPFDPTNAYPCPVPMLSWVVDA